MHAHDRRSEPLVLDMRTVPVLGQDEPSVRAASDPCSSPHLGSERSGDHCQLVVVDENASCNGETDRFTARAERVHAAEHDTVAGAKRVNLTVCRGIQVHPSMLPLLIARGAVARPTAGVRLT